MTSFQLTRLRLKTGARVLPVLLPFLAGGSVFAGDQSAPRAPSVVSPAAQGAGPSRYQPSRFSRRATLRYELVWGVDALTVKYAESGEVIRFSYRVLDVDKAKPLHEKALEPVLIDPKAGVSLSIPALEKIGKLRQTGTPVPGRSYWMAFSNKGRLVKRGDLVNVVIGQFHADGLRVE
jgi:hypothetical protein